MINYTLSKVKFGTNQKSIIANLSSEDEIKDICYVEDIGVVFIHGNELGLVDFSGKINYQFINGLNKPLSLFYTSRFHNCYIFENGGRELRYFPKHFNHLIPFLGSTYRNLLEKDLKMLTDDVPVMVSGCVDSFSDIYAMNSFLNSCMLFSGSEYKYVFTDFSNPQGIGHFNGDLYISDTDNNCIKLISKGHLGSFLDINMPTKLVIKNKIAYVISEQKNIFYFSLDKTNRKVFSSDGLISLDMDESRDFYVLEKI